MSCTMGLKRKLGPEDQDDPEKGPKVAALSEDPHPAYSLQRQAVLQLSLQKLCAQVETALVRRVLITNMLKYIQQELSQQGALIMPQTSSAAAEVSHGNRVDAEGSSQLTPAWVLEQDGELFLSLQSSVPSRPSQKDSFSSALAEIEDLCPTVTDPAASTPSLIAQLAPPECFSDRSSKLSSQTSELSEKQTPTHPGSNGLCEYVPTSSPVCLPELSLDDFLFSDIDSFLCELNACGQNASLTQGSPAPSRVVSMVTDDFMRSLTGQPFKTDLNELDHIMELLVGS
ncbi:SERTA domain-containing protein 2 [Salminus brasiliensis]|uniref:SERTA domain-containing protein 2 n=1 Tax=Salminus brasiliensis TaxID=930266 RepID=UPI003B838CA2